MRRALPVSLLFVCLTSGCWGEPASPSSDREAPGPAKGGVPSWVPQPTAEQQALLAPLERAVRTRAAPVYPDLDRFAYANNRPLGDAEDAVKFTKMVTQVLNDSPRFYSLQVLPSPSAANLDVQYGPPPEEPDGYKVIKRGADGIATLVPAAGAEEARAAVARGDELKKSGDLEGAIAAYRAALPKAPHVPALRMALASALTKAGRAQEAELAYREITSADPTFASAHLALAELASARGDTAGLRRALVEALAYHPSSKRGLELLRKLISGAPRGGPPGSSNGGWYDEPAAPAAPAPTTSAAGRDHPFPIFLDVDAAGAVHVATLRSEAAQIYGGCRAVMRYEPELRAQIWKTPPETPYSLSVAEEVVCIEAALGAYLAARTQSADKTDGDLERVLRIAREQGLSGYVMFEILGQRRPERARAAPLDVHRDTVTYLERWVLARREPVTEGVFTAER